MTRRIEKADFKFHDIICRGWLEDEIHPFVARLTRRVSAMLDLDSSSAEGFQVHNLFESHFTDSLLDQFLA